MGKDGTGIDWAAVKADFVAGFRFQTAGGVMDAETCKVGDDRVSCEFRLGYEKALSLHGATSAQANEAGDDYLISCIDDFNGTFAVFTD